MQKTTKLEDLPFLGVGMGLRHALLEETFAATNTIDWLEITPELYMGKGGKFTQILEKARSIYPIVSHGVSLSIGSIDDLNPEYIKKLKELFKIIDPLWFSDHLSYSSVSNYYFNDLIPLPRFNETINKVVDKIKYLQDSFQKEFLIENISYYVELPDNKMPEWEFISTIIDKSDCGMLLDVNNVYVNAHNHGWNPYEFFNNIPLDRVIQIHIAGHTHYPEGIVDSHGNPVCDDVWNLLDWVLKRCTPKGVMLERDLNIPPFKELKEELIKIRAIWRTHNPSLPPVIAKEKV